MILYNNIIHSHPIILLLLTINNSYAFSPGSISTKIAMTVQNTNRSVNQAVQKYSVIITDETCLFILNQFWKSSGLCPPDPHQESYKFLLAKDMKQNLFHLGSLPPKSILQIRVHWLLDLVKISVYPNEKVHYDFEYLDKFIDILHENSLKPGFEIMGNPSNYFSDFENRTQVYMWRNLVSEMASHYIGLYGIQYVRKWNFETWNEPDHHDFDNLNLTIQGFLNYFDACSEGLYMADKRLKFGGPGGSCRITTKGHSPICWALLNHVVNGKNYFTGQTGVRLDFISFHKKGNGSSSAILDDGFETINYVKNYFPSLSRLSFYNDEADPLKNWYIPQLWRADSTYASMVVKVILNHIYFYSSYNKKHPIKQINFDLLSDDNAFLSYFPYQFTERTLLARFQVNNTVPNYVEFVKKPVYAVFGLLSKLCSKVLNLTIFNQGQKINATDQFGGIATLCDKDKIVNIIFYNSADILKNNVSAFVQIELNVSKTFKSSVRWIKAEINNRRTNPYMMWQSLGMPPYPTTKEFSLLKDKEGPYIKGPWVIDNPHIFEFQLKIPNPGIVFLSICGKIVLKQVQNVRFLQAWNQTLQISWLDKYNKCVLTYNVLYSSSPQGPYRHINKKKIYFPSYWHHCIGIHCQIKGYYKICAVDYWGEHSPFSKVAFFNG